MSKKNSGLSLQFVLASSLIITIASTAAVVFVPWIMTSKQNIEEVVEGNVDQLNEQISQEVGQLLTKVRSTRDTLQLSVQRRLLNLTDQTETENLFLTLLETNLDATWVQFGYPNGDFVGAQRDHTSGEIFFHRRIWQAASRTTSATIHRYRIQKGFLQRVGFEKRVLDKPYYSPDRPWYRNAVSSLSGEAWSTYVYRTGNVPGTDYSSVLMVGNKPVGVIGIGVELRRISEFLNKLRSRRGFLIFVVNQNQELIASSDLAESVPEQVPGQVEAKLRTLASTRNPDLQRAYHALQSNQSSMGQEIKIHQDNYFISLTPLGYLDWSIGTVIPESYYIGDIQQSQLTLLFIVAGLVVVAGAASIALGHRYLSLPIVYLGRIATEIQTGQFGSLNLLIPISKRFDEIGTLARLLKRMGEEVQARENHFKEELAQLRIEIDEVKRAKVVKDITESDAFRDLQEKANILRRKRRQKDDLDQ